MEAGSADFSTLETDTPAQQFVLETESVLGSRILLSNESAEKARFTMRFNGNISVNIADLVDQIRSTTIVDSNVPDYEKAYYYLMEFHQHDFPVTGRTWIHEPSLYLNSIGAGLCDDAATALSIIWEAMGYQSRVWLLNGHVVSEVHTGERWQLYDADLQVHYFNRDGQVAGVEELAAQPDLIYSPFNPTTDDSYVYRRRIASIYATIEDNRLCTACADHTVERDLIFEIPEGGTLEWGQAAIDKQLPTIHLDSATNISLIKVTVPQGYDGLLDIPLALYDIRGSEADQVTIGSQVLRLGGNAAFDFLSQDTRTGSRVQAISFAQSTEPIEVFYLFNEVFAQIQTTNLLEITPLDVGPLDLKADILSDSLATRWVFGSDDSFQGLSFTEQRYLDISAEEPALLFETGAAFEINASIKLEPGVTTRRPVVDAHRFSIEIDEQNRPYVYFRARDDHWVGLRGGVLSANEWHDLAVSYDDGAISLTVNDSFVGSKAGAPMDTDYVMLGPYIGKSDHLGGLYFEGEIQHVSIGELPHEGSTVEYETKESSVASNSASNAVEVENEVAQVWEFGALTADKRAGLSFDGQQFLDISAAETTTLFDGGEPFEITARVMLESSTGTRRPILDAHRFSLEIDEHDRPYVYYRSAEGQWIGLRGGPLATDAWQTVAVSLSGEELSLWINGQLAGRRSRVSDMDIDYPLYGPFIGKSEHVGGLYFEGQIQHVSIRQMTAEPTKAPVNEVSELQSEPVTQSTLFLRAVAAARYHFSQLLPQPA